ncbi:MAG: hypothetical protein HDS13_02045 [Bacteroides sp.]|nr:hypothetical protein [Bacteroides sp.]
MRRNSSYHIAYHSSNIYNPFSFLQALRDGELHLYWNESGVRAKFLWNVIS